MEYLSFSETPRFARNAEEVLDDDALANLQLHICFLPETGKLVVGSGGIRKMRWTDGSRGKRGGLRVIYYYALTNGRVLLLDIYRKSEKADLSKDEIKELRSSVEIWLKDNE